jgi:superfamily II DNA/RNA helicase
MNQPDLSRDDLAAMYVDQIPYEPYPVQEEALLAWFTSHQGVLVCAPTGTGKTLIAEAAVFEALHTGTRVYYTTPLIALTDQKLAELQQSAVRWGFKESDIGLVTGNRRVNPEAKVLVVVAEILLNRLLRPDVFDFSDVDAVVMDEFHSFNDRERGIVWEFSLGMLPEHVRLLLLSATVGNSVEFIQWLALSHKRRLELVQSDERKIPLTFQWLPDMMLSEQIEAMAEGNEESRKVPGLVFCFNRDQCWSVAEQLKGKNLLRDGQKKELSDELEKHDFSLGVGPKIRQLLMRGVGVHHAGLLPRYRRIVEDLFQQKLLSIAICTETLAAGINLPARSVVIPSLLKGPPGKKKVLESSAAHQMFGRAGRPQYDSQGFVFGLPHEDDVKILRWREKYDAIPEDSKDPKMRRAKKALKKKMPKRRATQQYWSETQFEKLITAPAGKLQSRGDIPWRLLAHMLKVSPDVRVLRELVSKRLTDDKGTEDNRRTLHSMLMTLWRTGYVKLEPEPPKEPVADESETVESVAPSEVYVEPYSPDFAHPTESIERLLLLRGVNPLYGVFLINQLGGADRNELIQAMESLLEMPGSVARFVRVPSHDELPPGPLAVNRLDVHLLQLGLVSPEQLGAAIESEEPRGAWDDDERVFVLSIAEKLKILFDHEYAVYGVRVQPVWVAGELLEFGGDFNNYVTSKRLQKQEGILFRHILRLILLIQEFTQITPPDMEQQDWLDELNDIGDRLTESCRAMDPSSTEKTLEQARNRDLEES